MKTRELEVLDIPGAVKYLRGVFDTQLKGEKFDVEWVSEGLYSLIQNPQSVVLVSGDKKITGLLVGSLDLFMFTGEPSVHCSFCAGRTKELLAGLEAWAKERGVSRISFTAYQKQQLKGYRRLATVYTREMSWDG